MGVEKIASFADWSNDHPSDRLPGDRLDAQFDNHANAIRELEQRIARLLRADGKLAHDLLTVESFPSDLHDEMVRRFVAEAQAERAAAEQTLAEIEVRKREIEGKVAEIRAFAAQSSREFTHSLDLVNSVVSLQADLHARVEPLAAEARAAATSLTGNNNVATLSAAAAEDWAEVSMEWAEHMPDTIPANILATNAVTGDHWSSRWWANRAASTVGYLPIYYAGASPTPPTTTVNGDPITVGSIWFDTDPPPGQTMVWNGSAWVAAVPPPSTYGEINLVDWGASNTGVDCTDILRSALATGRNVYMPKGTYRWHGQITVGSTSSSAGGQRLRGDGLGTYIIIEPNFDPAATSIILLLGSEGWAPILQDFQIAFAQPTAANDRAQFVTLGTAGAGTGLKGVKYPPAILFGTSGNNRFKIQRVRIGNAWQGIFQAVGTQSGGWWMEDIEMSAYECGLQVAGNIDMSHIKGWHHWYFNQTAANDVIMRDGQCYCMRLGFGDQTQSLNIQDLSDFTGRIQIDNLGSMIQIANLTMDSVGVEVINSLWVHIANSYSTCASTGPASGKATFWMQAGRLNVVNHNGWCGNQGYIDQSGGRLSLVSSLIQTNIVDVPLVKQSGGTLRIAESELYAAQASAWTVPLVSCTGGTLLFNNNNFSPSVGDVGAVAITTDGIAHSVTDNFFNGWGFTPPGTLGTYQNQNSFYTKAITAGSYTAGSLTYTSAVGMVLNSTSQRTITFYENSVIRWSIGASTVASGSDFYLLRYNTSGVIQPNPLVVRSATGIMFADRSPFIASYSIAPEALPAAYSWRGIGLVGIDGIAPGFEVFQTATASSGYIRFARSRGTMAVPTVVANGDTLGDIIYGGYDGTAWQSRTAIIRAGVAAPWVNGTTYDSFLQFYGTIGTTLTSFLVLSSVGLTVPKVTTAAAPGAGAARLAFVAGTNAGTGKLVAYAGTSATPFTILDNIGAGF